MQGFSEIRPGWLGHAQLGGWVEQPPKPDSRIDHEPVGVFCGTAHVALQNIVYDIAGNRQVERKATNQRFDIIGQEVAITGACGSINIPVQFAIEGVHPAILGLVGIKNRPWLMRRARRRAGTQKNGATNDRCDAPKNMNN